MNLSKCIKSVSLEDVLQQSNKLTSMLLEIKSVMLAPQDSKPSPVFGSGEIQTLCGIDKAKLAYRLTLKDLPGGVVKGKRREWSLPDAQSWVRSFRSDCLRPEGASAVTITVANFKGGVAKTTSAVSLAQGLSLMGHKVLFVDLDPQASATTLFGVLPTDSDQTALSLFNGEQDSIDYAIRKTYWEGIDLVGASNALFAAEFGLPARQKDDPGFEFWKVLDFGLDSARSNYDVIVIDTPPSLSYITINAMLAADGMVIPVPPSPLDFASSAQFWNLFSDLCQQLFAGGRDQKTFEFIDVLMSRVESNDTASSVVRKWILEAYGDKVLPIEIPKTSVASSAAVEFGTVYDVDRSTVSAKTYDRARSAYDRYCVLVEEQIRAVWEKQITELTRELS